MGFLDQHGLLSVTDDIYQRFTPSAKITASLTDWMKATYSLRYNRTSYDRPIYLNQSLFADWARQSWPEVPSYDDNGYIYMDEEVPFYEMLTHGYIAETSTYNNEFHDRRLQLLRSIEYGLIPYYSLTVNSVDWKENGSFSSRFSEVYEDIVKEYNECESALGDVVEVPIVHHSAKKDLAEVVYDNGIRIIINYSDKDRTVDGITIQPMDFVKITGGEGDVNDQEKLKIKEIKAEARGGKERFSVYSSLAVWIFIILSVSIVVLCGISIFKHKRHTEL
jgi:hypothetical protein